SALEVKVVTPEQKKLDWNSFRSDPERVSLPELGDMAANDIGENFDLRFAGENEEIPDGWIMKVDDEDNVYIKPKIPRIGKDGKEVLIKLVSYRLLRSHFSAATGLNALDPTEGLRHTHFSLLNLPLNLSTSVLLDRRLNLL